jgi:hypothetical protein
MFHGEGERPREPKYLGANTKSGLAGTLALPVKFYLLTVTMLERAELPAAS